jgi:hypothetical protein
MCDCDMLPPNTNQTSTVNIHPINAAGLAVLLMRDPTLATDTRLSVLAIPRLLAPHAVLHPSPV